MPNPTAPETSTFLEKWITASFDASGSRICHRGDDLAQSGLFDELARTAAWRKPGLLAYHPR
jgi:hypothetical protein